MTNGSFTERQTISSTPFLRSSADFSTNPGRCFIEQVGVYAPGTAKNTTVRPLVSSPIDTSFGPPSPISLSFTSGSASPALMPMWILRRSHLTVRARPVNVRHGPGSPPPQSRALRRPGSRGGPLLLEGHRVHRRRPREAHRRHRQHLDRDHAVQLHAA